MKQIKRTLSLLLALALLLACAPQLPLTASAAVLYSGTCGENLTWTLDSEGMLTISGNGKMDDFSANSSPWAGYISLISEISIGEDVSRIGSYAFYGCTELTSISIPENVTSIAVAAFKNCTKLADISLPDTSIALTASTFDNTAYYNESENWVYGARYALYVGNHLIKVKTDAIASMEVREGTVTIAASAFSACDRITGVTLPDSLLRIGDHAFSVCYDLVSVNIPNGVTYIGEKAFYGTSLDSIHIPASVEHIGTDAFYQPPGNISRSLNTITVDENNPIYCDNGNNLIEKESKTLILGVSGSIPDDGSVCRIGTRAFVHGSMGSISIPEGVTHIEKYAFQGCSGMSSIKIPRTLISIEEGAFDGCSSIKYVYYSGSEQEWNDLMAQQTHKNLLNASVLFNIDPDMDVEEEAVHLDEVPEGYVGIYTKSDLDSIRENPTGQYILMNHIEFASEDFEEGGAFYNDGTGWVPIGNSAETSFQGVLDGNGYTIKNMTIHYGFVEKNEKSCYVGLIGYNTGTVKNLGMVGYMVSYGPAEGSPDGCLYSGSIAGYNDGVLENCYSIWSSDAYSTTNSAVGYVGGIVGYSNSSVSVKNCRNYGSVKGIAGGSAYCYVGGIAGYGKKLENCFNGGTIYGGQVSLDVSYAGGIAGEAEEISWCTNVGSVKAAAAGGICGEGGTVSYCYNSGAVTARGRNNAYAGGIVGSYGTIQCCGNGGTIEAYASYMTAGSDYYSYAGGIAGRSGTSIYDSFNSGSVCAYSGRSKDTAYSGGIAGTCSPTNNVAYIVNCYNVGTSIGSTLAGYRAGLVGFCSCDVDASGSVCLYSLTGVNFSRNHSYHHYGEQPLLSNTTDMKLQETFTEFDFGTIWTMEGEETYLYPEIIGLTMTHKTKLVDITIAQTPEKTTYSAGDELNLSGMVVYAYYTNGAAQEITGYFVEGDTSRPGNQRIVVNYLGKTASFEINVQQAYLPGDIDGNGVVNREDVTQLLLHVSMPAAFPIDVPADFTGDGAVTREDVVQLLLHVSMPDMFPLQ